MKKYQFRFLLIGLLCCTLLITIPPISAYSYELQGQETLTELGINDESDDQQTVNLDWYNKPSSYAQLVSWYQNLEALYPAYLEVFKANEVYNTGVATGGYDLYYVRITNESLGLQKPEVLFLGGPHGDETVGTVGMFWFTDWFMRMAFTSEPCPDYSKDWLRWLIDHREIYFEVSHNPYGYDKIQRGDGNGWDLNREADYDGPGSPTGGIWASVNGQTLHAFVDNHTIRVGVDFHGGARMLLYAWGSTHSNVNGLSPLSGRSYGYAPPDFYFYDASSLRLGDYIGDYGGNLNANNIGTTPGTVGYRVKGGIGEWAYGADISKNPVEDPWVIGNYPGSGILWLSPEMSTQKNPAQSTFGNDTTAKFGAEVRRIILHQTDLAQPSVSWQYGTIANNGHILPEKPIPLYWQVNGSLVVDHTSVQWGTNPDPIHYPQFTTDDVDDHAGDYLGGTGWDNADNGQTTGVIYQDSIVISTPGDYYFVAKAQVDQVYANVLRSDVYGTHSYLRLVKERTNDSYYEELQGTDGTEIITGQTWWYSPILHVSVTTHNDAPETPIRPSGQKNGTITVEYTYTTRATDSDDDQLYYLWDWGDGTQSDWLGPFASGEEMSMQKSWGKKGIFLVKVKVKDISGVESDWSDPLPVTMPFFTKISLRMLVAQFLDFLAEVFHLQLN